MIFLENWNRQQNSKCWDAIAEKRFYQESSNLDESFSNVLVPNILKHLPSQNIEFLLDAGCGVGVLTNILTQYASRVDGVDGSKKCIDIAKEKFKKNTKLAFFEKYIENFNIEKKYDVVIANMVLMDLVNLEAAIKQIFKLIKEKGCFIFTITHPCFWSKYWNYENQKKFNYNKEIFVEHSFDITSEKGSFKTVHIHRPLSKYFEIIIKNGFTIKAVEELYGKNFDFPRFLLIKCFK